MATDPIRNHDTRTDAPREGRDGRIGSAVSGEHRAILENALAGRQTPSFNEILASIPDVGLDSDFERNRA